ncbi:hypothetical protein L7F22_068353 [Adiantum nelumboides]|nr:hypothetical protein [Adiantum nelumboides]
MSALLSEALTLDPTVKGEHSISLDPALVWPHLSNFGDRAVVLFFNGKLTDMPVLVEAINVGFSRSAVDKIFYLGSGFLVNFWLETAELRQQFSNYWLAFWFWFWTVQVHWLAVQVQVCLWFRFSRSGSLASLWSLVQDWLAVQLKFEELNLAKLQEAESKNVEMGLSGLEASMVGPLGGSNRAGLFRTPISGGVQSATSSHGLPSPALAVRNLMEQARFAHLCTIMSHMHHRRRGYPFGSLVDFAADSLGHPIFSLSPLAIHTRNVLADPRCTLVVQIPGWSGLSNARVTIFGDVYPLPNEQQECAHKKYTAKHQQGATQQWGNFYYYRMESISDIYFIGGFGTVAWVDVKEFEGAQPDVIAANGAEQTLKKLNTKFSRPLRDRLSVESEVDDAALISIDSKGVDIRVRQGAQFNVQRLSFDIGHPVESLDQAEAALEKIMEWCYKGPRNF